MERFLNKGLFYLFSFSACAVMSLSTGCASGGFKLTRQYAGWVNSQNLIIRIILYILTLVVFGVTLLIDAVVFNTMDFWQGRVSSGTFNFKDSDKTYHVLHETLPGTHLKRSTITITSPVESLKVIVLNETPTGEIELLIDGRLHTRVSNISSIPMAWTYDKKGVLVEEKALLFAMPLAAAKFLVRN